MLEAAEMAQRLRAWLLCQRTQVPVPLQPGITPGRSDALFCFPLALHACGAQRSTDTHKKSIIFFFKKINVRISKNGTEKSEIGPIYLHHNVFCLFFFFLIESYHVAPSCLGFARWNRLVFGTHSDMPAFTFHVLELKVCTIRSKHVLDTLKITENGFVQSRRKHTRIPMKSQ